MMFELPCITDRCAGSAAAGRETCNTCHDRNGYPAGWSRSKDEAWLNYRPCSETDLIPIADPGCNAHPVTPIPAACRDCTAALAPSERKDAA